MLYDWMTFVMVGAQDMFSPVQLAALGVFLLLLLSFSAKTSKGVLALFTGYFLVSFIIFGVLCDIGVVPFLWSSNEFLVTASWFYCILGVLFLGVAWLFAVQWRLLINDNNASFTPWPRPIKLGITFTGLVAVTLALALAALANVWPQTLHVILQGAMSFESGRLFGSVGGLIIYELTRNVGVVVLAIMMVLIWRGKVIDSLRGSKSLVASMMVAFYMAVGGALIYFHYNKG
ncbi:MAG: hypothetical protein HQL17_04070 [Candidatus Omnitrophica bacterium]|nr:hypothetical protein [Candidatus Omnitrophota bacterium]